MYHYLLCSYQQWCDLNPEAHLDAEPFVDLIHNIVGYDKQEMKHFLARQPWFHSTFNEDLP